MPNTFNFSSWVAMNSLRLMTNKLVVAEMFNSDFNKEFRREFAVGQTVTIPLPQWFEVNSGFGYTPQALDRPSTTISINQPANVHFEVPTPDAELFLERGAAKFRSLYLDSASATLAQHYDKAAAEWAFYNTPNIVGVLGTNPTSPSILGSARTRLIQLSGWDDPVKRAILPPSAMQSIVDNSTTIFNPPDEITKQWKSGAMGQTRGFDCFDSMSLVYHTAGTWGGAVVVYGSNQTGTSLVITATAGDTFKRGDRINIANVYEVNPRTLQSTGVLKQFVVQADVTAVGGAGGDTLSLLPAIVGPGSHYQNVSALPQNGAALTLWPGTTTPNGKAGYCGIALTKKAFGIASASLEVPDGGSHQQDPTSGIDIAYSTEWDTILGRRKVHRLDSMYGFGNLYFDHCAVVIACGV